MRLKGLLPSNWAFSLVGVDHLPVTGDMHPLKREAVKWMSFSNGFALFVAAAIFLSWYLWSHRTVEESGPPAAEIVKFVELGVPPSITQQTATSQVSVANVAPPSIGVPEPVPEMQAQTTTIATQAEMSDALAPITMSDLGSSGAGDSLVVNVTRNTGGGGADFQAVSEMPVRLTIQPPRYPDLAREAGIEGTVVIRTLVGRDGKVKKVMVDSGGPEILQNAAMECAKSAVFRPALQRDKPVEVWVLIPVVFSLRQS